MKIQIPDKDRKLIQLNQGEIQGNIYASYNLDLESNKGKIRVSPQTLVKRSNADLATLTYPSAIVRSSADGTDKLWLLCNKQLFNIALPTSSALNFVVDTSTSTPTSILGYKVSDMIEWQGSLFVSGATDVATLPIGTTTWTTNYYSNLASTALVNNVPHPLNVGFNNLFLIGNGKYVASIDVSATISPTKITLRDNFEIIWIISSSTEYWIGARNKVGGQGEVFMWDGYSENFNGNYKIGSEIPLAGIIKDNVCYVINNIGQLLAFNGNGFSEVARLPVANYMNKRWQDWSSGNDLLMVHKNGITLIDNNIHILLNANINATTTNKILLENMLSGIWEYTPEHGLVHKYSITKSISSAIVDYGSPDLVFAGVLYNYDKRYGNFIAGARVYSYDGIGASDGTIDVIVNSDLADTTAKSGYFITSQIQTSELQENWQKICFNIKKLLNATDKVCVKYRIFKKDYANLSLNDSNLATSFTWVDSTHCTTDVLTVANSNIAVGDELEIISGEGSGLSTNISAITGTTTLTLTIDQTVTNASGTFSARLSNWKNVGTDIAIQDLDNFKLPINANSDWIQFKVVMFFTGKNEINKLIVKSEPQLKVE